LPPEPELAHVKLIVTKDRNGLNNGVFFAGVNQWKLTMFASALIREYMPDLHLKYTEQSGTEEVIKRVSLCSPFSLRPTTNSCPTALVELVGCIRASALVSSPSSARPGTLLIHSASNRNGKRPDRMSHWSKSHMTRLRLGTSRSMTLYIQLRLQSTGNELDMGKVRRRFVRTLGSEIGHENGDASNCRCIAIDNPRVQPTWIGNTLYHG
jgi:hypothetical protein